VRRFWMGSYAMKALVEPIEPMHDEAVELSREV